MAETTRIGWTDKTWNPWYGCTKVSPGCAHCYMFRDREKKHLVADVVQRSKTTFRAPLRWKKPELVFTCSWSDFFHADADAWRDEAWEIIRQTPHLTYQILTKRPERIAACLPTDWGEGWPNVWLGVSVENQRWMERAARLARIPARIRFLSCEPLLGPVSFRWAEWDSFAKRDGSDGRNGRTDHLDGLRRWFHWVIAGGESGPEAHPCDPDWLRTLRDQCAEAGVPYFLKQLGGHPDARAHEKAVLDGACHAAMPPIFTSTGNQP